MKLEQSFEVAAPLDRVWAALIDVEQVAPCLPGAEVSGRNDDGSYNGSFRVRLGPTAAAYTGKLELESVDESSHTATLQAAGTDRRGQGNAKATIVSTVKEGEAGTTVVEVVSDYSITGKMARFGRGPMIEEIGNRLLTEFAASLQAMLAGPGDYETFVGMPAVAGAKAGAGATAGAGDKAGAGAKAGEPEKPKRKPRKDLTAAAEAVAAASEPGAPAEPEPVAAEPEPASAEAEPTVQDVPDLALEAAAEDELPAVMPEASEKSQPPAAEVPQPPAEPELMPPAPESVPAPASEPELVPPAPEAVPAPSSEPEIVPPKPVPAPEPPHEPEPAPVPPEPEPEPEPVPPEPEPVPVPPAPEPEPVPEPPPAPEPPPPPPPPPAPEPPPPPPAAEPPPPPPAPEPEALDGLALMRTVIVDRIKSNPLPILALVLGVLFLRRRRRRGS